MNVESSISDPVSAPENADTRLLQGSAPGLVAFQEKAEKLKGALAQLAKVGDDQVRASVGRLTRQLDEFEPGVTMIGQVKAGKTSLINAMVGWPDLLPADVNPWTSVVTSLHMSPKPAPTGNSAVFQFFDEDEWGRLLDKGGRIGELADRAGAEDELAVVRQQIEDMREKSRARLGRRFELLLGQEHDYSYFDKDLIERYVCLGDDFEDDVNVSRDQGRFADITRAADLHFPRPEFATRLCIRDTPGVNDTFMMREQITIRAIRGSRHCVVVLSAHQALSSVDMALIRLISNIKSREVVIFVNRIDELSDPVNQVEEIRNSIRDTLSRHEGPAAADIVFGSAYWANKALSGDLDSLSRDSARSLVSWAEKTLEPGAAPQSPAEMIWALSGVPELLATLSRRMADTVGQETIDKVARKAMNLAQGMRASNRVVYLKQKPDPDAPPPDKDEIIDRLDAIIQSAQSRLDDEFQALVDQFAQRVDRSNQSFVDRATASLIAHLEKYGEGSVWQYDPAGLRVLLRSGYKIFGSRAQKAATGVFETSARELSDLFASAFGELGPDFSIEAPSAPRVPPPVFLGQTIALDLQLSWWKNWWQKRRGYHSFASDFSAMIMAETTPMVDELKNAQVASIHRDARTLLDEFLNEQREILLGVLRKSHASAAELKEMMGVQSSETRESAVKDTLSTLNQCVG